MQVALLTVAGLEVLAAGVSARLLFYHVGLIQSGLTSLEGDTGSPGNVFILGVFSVIITIMMLGWLVSSYSIFSRKSWALWQMISVNAMLLPYLVLWPTVSIVGGFFGPPSGEPLTKVVVGATWVVGSTVICTIAKTRGVFKY